MNLDVLVRIIYPETIEHAPRRLDDSVVLVLYLSTEAYYQIFDSVNLRHLLRHVFQSESKRVKNEMLTNRNIGACWQRNNLLHSFVPCKCEFQFFLFSVPPRTGAMNRLPPGQWSCLLLLFPCSNRVALCLCISLSFLFFFRVCLLPLLLFFSPSIHSCLILHPSLSPLLYFSNTLFDFFPLWNLDQFLCFSLFWNSASIEASLTSR